MGRVNGKPRASRRVSSFAMYATHSGRTLELRDADVSRIADRTLALLRLMERAGAGRILLVEPPVPELGETIRFIGFTGELNALVRRPHPLLAISGGLYSQRIEGDWPAWFARSTRSRTTATAPSAEPSPHGDGLSALHGPYDAVLVCNGFQHLPAATRLAWLTILVPLIAPRGFLLVSQPPPSQSGSRFSGQAVTSGMQTSWLERSLLHHGAVLAADPPDLAANDGELMTIFQKLSIEEAQQVGVVRRVSLRQIEASPTLRANLIATYRESFAGDDWREWARCSREGCGQQYSREETERLDPPNQCNCGWHLPLQPYHTAESIASKLASELAESQHSCCFLRLRDDRVEGFSWGYVSDITTVERTLLAGLPSSADLHARLCSLLSAASAADGPTAVYYHSELGVAEHGRSLSLLRAILQRSLQFAFDRGARAAVTRTSRRARLYPILVGLGMHELFSYASHSEELPPMAYNAVSRRPSEERAAEDRVILGGELQALLRTFLTSSDRRLAVHIAHTLRQQQRSERESRQPDNAANELSTYEPREHHR